MRARIRATTLFARSVESSVIQYLQDGESSGGIRFLFSHVWTICGRTCGEKEESFSPGVALLKYP